MLVVGLLAALLLVHGQHLQALLVAQCRHNARQRDCLQRLQALLGEADQAAWG